MSKLYIITKSNSIPRLMKFLYVLLIYLAIGLLIYGYSKSETDPEIIYEIAFMPDIHFHDVFSDFSTDGFPGLSTEYNGEIRTASIRTMEAQLTSTRLFNENYFAFIAALDDAVKRGIKLIALPGDFSDDGQPVHIKGLVEILLQYKDEYNLQFFITPGNHDPVRPFTMEAGESDFLGTNGRPQPIYSNSHTRCINQSSQSLKGFGSTELNPHPVVCSDLIKNLGYQDLFDVLGNFGLNPDTSYFYYETPFASYIKEQDLNSQKKREFSFNQRQYEICHEGSGGKYRKVDYTHCNQVMDMSYLVEPVEDLWLLAIDANVYIPQNNDSSDPARNFSGSGNTGYNKLITHKKHLLKWLEDVVKRAKEQGKTLIAFSHFPAVDFYNGAKPTIEQLWGENEFQLARIPQKNTSVTLAGTGLNLHVAGHMHMNGTSVVRDSLTGNVLTNIQVPSVAAYVPAYKIVRNYRDSDNVEIETAVMDNVPNFDTFFSHYRDEWDYLDSIGYSGTWDRAVLESENYSEYTNWHIKELSRLRFLPREWPDEVKDLISGLTGRDMLIASQLQSSALFTDYEKFLENSKMDIENMTPDFSHDWIKAKKKAAFLAQESGFKLSDFEKWNGVDLSVDFYRLRNAGELAIPDITENRIKQYLFIANTLFESTIKITTNRNNQQQFDETFKNKFRTVFEVMSIFVNRLPDNTFQVNLETGKIKNLSVDK